MTAFNRQLSVATQPPAEVQAQGGGEVFAWFRKQPRAWEVVKDSDLSERPAPGKMLAEGWTPVYTAPPSAPETEENVAADSYHHLTELLEPYVAREGSNPNGPFPASVAESFQMLLEHWKATQAPSAPVGVEADILRIVNTAIDVCNDRDRPAMAEDLEAVRLYVEQAAAALANVTGDSE